MKNFIKDRTYNQIISHSQKFFLRLKRYKDDNLGLDFTSKNIQNLKAILKIIKENEINLNMYNKLLYIISEKISFGKKVKRPNNEKIFLSTEENVLSLNESEDENISNKYDNIIYNKNDFIEEVEERRNQNVKVYSSEYSILSTDEEIEKELDDSISFNIYNGKELIFLKKLLI